MLSDISMQNSRWHEEGSWKHKQVAEENVKQESRAVAREPRDAAAVVFGLKFTDGIHHKFKSSQASKARLHSSKRTRAKQNLAQNGHSRARVLESVEGR